MAITECFKADKVETTSLNSTVDMIEQPAYFKQFYVRQTPQIRYESCSFCPVASVSKHRQMSFSKHPRVSLSGSKHRRTHRVSRLFSQVRWLDFCDAVDMANTIKGLENMPLGSTMYRAPAHAVGRSGGAPPAVLQSLREQIRVRGVLVKHFFQVRPSHLSGALSFVFVR